jgi:putative hydrolase of the HAD superfamily
MVIKAVFFDIDDTLFDSTLLTTRGRMNSITAMIDAGLPIKDADEVYRSLQEVIVQRGSNYSKHYDMLLETLGVGWDPKIVGAGVVAYERTKAGYLKPFPEVVPVILGLKSDYRLGVISNGLAVKQWEKLTWLGLQHLFDVVVTSEEAGSEKPDADIFNTALGAMETKARDAVMVGDRLDTDIIGARGVCMGTRRLKKGKYEDAKGDEADFVIKDISELPYILSKME